jgi:hypothetical protein
MRQEPRRTPAQDILLMTGERLERLWMRRRNGDDPTAELDNLLSWVRRIVLHGTGKGVSLMDAALVLNDGDLELAKQTKYRWTRTERSFFEHLPRPIGTDPRHAQTLLFEPSTICALIERVEGAHVCRQSRLLQALKLRARYARPNSCPSQ